MIHASPFEVALFSLMVGFEMAGGRVRKTHEQMFMEQAEEILGHLNGCNKCYGKRKGKKNANKSRSKKAKRKN